MLRPNVIIAVLNNKYKYSSDSFRASQLAISTSDEVITNNDDEVITNTTFRYIIKPVSFSSVESRSGINVTFETKSDRYFLNNGDRIFIECNYLSHYRESDADRYIKSIIPTLPIMIVTDVTITSNFTLKVSCIDEFSYICQTTNVIPIDIENNPDQLKFVQDNFRKKLTDDKKSVVVDANPSLSLDQMLGYLQSVINPKRWFSKSRFADSTTFKSGDPFKYIGNPSVPDIGKWAPDNNTKIKTIIDQLSNVYYINIFQTTYCLPISVEVPGVIPVRGRHIKLIDDFNIISDDLKYINPIEKKKVVKYTFSEKKKVDGKDTISTDVWYGYYDSEGKIVVTNSENPGLLSGYFMDEFKIGGAQIFTAKQRKLKTREGLISNNFFGLCGTLNTFNYEININDVINIEYNNILRAEKYDDSSLKGRQSGFFGIKSIKRTFDSNGLFMTIEPRQQLGGSVNESGNLKISEYNYEE